MRKALEMFIYAFKLWNILPNDFIGNFPISYHYDLFCAYFAVVCDEVLKLRAHLDPAMDDVSRYAPMELAYPAGTGYRCILHYL